jgi:HSP20 family protein
MGRVPFDWDEDIHRLGERADDFFDRVFGLASAPRYVLHHAWRPAVDVYQVSDGFVVLVELAGVEESDLNVTVENARLRVAGTRPVPEVAPQRQPLQLEIEHGPFERQISLPEGADAENIHARIRNGILFIHLPVRKEKRPVKVRVTEEP